jgi:replicative DNA helicase
MNEQSQLPHDYETEAALIGSILLNWGDPGEAEQIITASDFHRERNATIYERILDIFHRHGKCNLTQLKADLQQRGLLDDVGGLEYLIEISDVGNISSIAPFARIIRDRADRRQLIVAAEQAIRAASQTGQPVAELVDRLQSQMFSLGGEAADTTKVSGLGGVAMEIYHDLAKWLETGKPESAGLKTGLDDLDRLTGGFQPGQLVVLAAGTGCGKSALALQLVLQAVAKGVGVAIFSLEMTKRQLTERALANISGVPLNSIRGNPIPSADEFAALSLAVGRLADPPVYAVEQRDLTAERLRSKARWLKNKHGIGLVVVDYLQLMRGSRRENRNIEVAELSRACKLLALELEVPLLLLSQLNRDSQRDSRRPRLCDLRDSGAIEMDADVVLFLHDPSKLTDSPGLGYSPDEEKNVELIVAKHRQGPTGCVPLVMNGAQQSFRSVNYSFSPTERSSYAPTNN